MKGLKRRRDVDADDEDLNQDSSIIGEDDEAETDADNSKRRKVKS